MREQDTEEEEEEAEEEEGVLKDANFDIFESKWENGWCGSLGMGSTLEELIPVNGIEAAMCCEVFTFSFFLFIFYFNWI